MNTARNTMKATLIAMVTLAGAGTTLAQVRQDPPANRPAEREAYRSTARETARAGLNFRTADWLLERDVRNANDEKVASITDLIVDRGSGRIDYAILNTGSILGMGGKSVAVSYSSLTWNNAKEHFELPLTPEQLKEFPEFSEGEWKGAMTDMDNDGVLRRRLITDATAGSRDPYAASLGEARQLRVKGEVTNVERVSRGEYGEYVVLTVRTEDGERRVAMGPSWYVNSGAFAPMRGDEVTIEAMALARDPERTVVARTLRTGDRDMTLRGEDGAPTWTISGERTKDQLGYAGRRYLLLSELDGARVDCRGTECGTVDEVIVEGGSGTLAFLSIDPNENFLGIADTKRLVPWSVVSVATDEVVRLDASKEMVLASPVTPDETTQLNSGGMGESVYKAYEVPMPRFEASRHTTTNNPVGMKDNAWSHKGPIFSSIKKDTHRTISGKNVGTSEVKFDNGSIQSARAITIEENGQKTLVVLGPAWYLDNQKLPCKIDGNVTVETYQATIDGKTYLLAKSIDCGGAKTVLLNEESGVPVWDRR